VDPGKRRGLARDQPASDNQAATKQLDASILPRTADYAPAYIAVMVDRFGTPRRRPYLNLHHASLAVQRAQAQGRQAWLILCKLEPITASLDLDCEVTE
jgi:hypothetical protein